jgi:hypothetical protein
VDGFPRRTDSIPLPKADSHPRTIISSSACHPLVTTPDGKNQTSETNNLGSLKIELQSLSR